jgi:hypothetical protein
MNQFFPLTSLKHSEKLAGWIVKYWNYCEEHAKKSEHKMNTSNIYTVSSFVYED